MSRKTCGPSDSGDEDEAKETRMIIFRSVVFVSSLAGDFTGTPATTFRTHQRMSRELTKIPSAPSKQAEAQQQKQCSTQRSGKWKPPPHLCPLRKRIMQDIAGQDPPDFHPGRDNPYLQY